MADVPCVDRLDATSYRGIFVVILVKSKAEKGEKEIKTVCQRVAKKVDFSVKSV